MDNQRLRLQVLNNTNPSLRVAAAPKQQLSVNTQPGTNVAPLTVQTATQNPNIASGANTNLHIPTPTGAPSTDTPYWAAGSQEGTAGVAGKTPGPSLFSRIASAIPLADAASKLKSNFSYLTGPVSTQAQRNTLISNQTAAANNSEYLKAIQGVGDVPSSATIQAQKMAAAGAKAPEINQYLKTSAQALSNQNRHMTSDIAQVGLFAVPGIAESKNIGLAAKTAIDAATGGGFGAATTYGANPNATATDYAKSIAGGAALGGAARLVGGAASSIWNNTGARKTLTNLSSAIANSHDAQAIQEALHSSPEIARFLANETDPDLIKNFLKEAGLGGKGALKVLKSTTTTNTPNDSPIPFLDPMNPTQSQVPIGFHPDNAADPVPVVQAAAQKAKTVDEFKQYVAAATGEEKAAIDSALNGMTPDEFYAKAGGGTAVTTPTTATVPARQASKVTLPEQYQAAITKAGGTIPDTTIHLPSKGVYARLSKEQAAALADETKHVQSNAEDIVHLSAHTPALQRGAREVSLEELASQSPNAQKTLDAIKSAETPAVNDVSPAAATVAAQTAESTPARQQLIEGLRGATRQSNQDAAALTAGRAERAAQAQAATSGLEGEAATAARLKALGGTYGHRGVYTGIGNDQSSAIYDQLLKELQNHPAIGNDQFKLVSAEDALSRAVKGISVDGRTTGAPTASQINLLRTYFGNDVADAVTQAVEDSKSLGSKVTNAVGEVAGLPKSIMASMDLSGTLRQGGILGSRFPKELGQSFKKQLEYFGSEDGFKEGMARIASQPNYQEKLDVGLALTGTEALDKSEEAFASSLAERIPGLGRGVAASDRAYTGFLTEFRNTVYDKITQAAEQSGKALSLEEKKSLARFINTASGRGDLGKYLENHSQTLSTALFSPRLWKSRLDMLNPVYYARLKGPARVLALQTAGTFAAEAGTVLGLLSLVPGVSVETDMRSSDFAKIKYHNTRYDILGGLQQNMVFAWREISGETKSSQTGNVSKFARGIPDFFKANPQQVDKGLTQKNRLSIAGDMIQNKENPLISAASQIAKGKDRGGNPVNPWTTLAQLAVPLPFSNIVQIANDEGSLKNPLNDLKGLAMASPDFIGVSAQNYGTIPTKDQGKPNAQGQPTYNGPIAENMVTDYNGKAVLDKNGKPVTVTFPNGADATTKQAMLTDKRTAAVKDAYVRTLPEQTQSLMKLNDSQLKGYVKSGQITQDEFDHIKNVQKTADSVSKGNNYDVPEGVKSPLATAHFQHFNSMDAKDQKAWLNQKPDATSTKITEQVNAQRMKGLDPFQPSNKLAQLYANYEKDINTHQSGDGAYSAIDLRNKAKAFQTEAAKMNYNSNVNDIYTEGGNSDLKTLVSEGKITKPDLDAAIKLDNQLYAAGLTSELKFSKKFRNAFGYSVPSNGPASSSGGSSSTSQQLGSLLHTPAAVKGLPKFSAAARQNPASTIKFNAPNVIPSKGNSRVTVGGFRTTKLNTLRNSVAN